MFFSRWALLATIAVEFSNEIIFSVSQEVQQTEIQKMDARWVWSIVVHRFPHQFHHENHRAHHAFIHRHWPVRAFVAVMVRRVHQNGWRLTVSGTNEILTNDVDWNWFSSHFDADENDNSESKRNTSSPLGSSMDDDNNKRTSDDNSGNNSNSLDIKQENSITNDDETNSMCSERQSKKAKIVVDAESNTVNSGKFVFFFSHFFLMLRRITKKSRKQWKTNKVDATHERVSTRLTLYASMTSTKRTTLLAQTLKFQPFDIEWSSRAVFIWMTKYENRLLKNDIKREIWPLSEWRLSRVLWHISPLFLINYSTNERLTRDQWPKVLLISCQAFSTNFFSLFFSSYGFRFFLSEKNIDGKFTFAFNYPCLRHRQIVVQYECVCECNGNVCH